MPFAFKNWISALATSLAACAGVVACSSSSTGTGSASSCSNDYSGRWKLSGSCVNTSCDLTQNACTLAVRCDDATQGSGAILGTSVTLNGLLGSGVSGGCNVAFDASRGFTMSCTSSQAGAQPCTAVGTCQSGSCGARLVSDSSGSSGSSGSTSVACEQKPGADGDKDCAGQPDKPRKLDCDSAQTDAALAAGCARTNPGGSDVCCPLSVTGASSGSPSGVGPGSAPVTCNALVPKVFPPVAGTGPYCDKRHCALGELCCFDQAAFVVACGGSCPAGNVPIACYSKSECPSGTDCCFDATADTTSCSYLTIRGNTGSVCATSCKSTQLRACANSSECAGKTCTAAYFLNPSGNATSVAQAGICR